ncbi:N-acetylmuramoyl-L-alanine amidase [Fictibacillus terranigra]|uniref:N-acetylmuramoyl-L-alanine amidase n=1 Tax=Fictibacillus terranigra TaxID=3058424 RepID=A0ABT8E794_9BACL|nr:N-acetylmuramoyl-L-alanine amidase [Fictibacillus sp. CENA-BCM004]MDN4073778.1 N-acetylmuramoyl-L-alanine amidase [Fictibacillus sp. CENA-BCM004]
MPQRYNITSMLIDKKWKQRPGSNRIPRYAVAHDTGNEGSSALQNFKYFNSRELDASAHVFIDDQEVLMIIPLHEKAWHVRKQVSDANDWAIGVELCYGGKISGEEAYKRYVWFFAWLCESYEWNPMLHVKGHFQLDPGRRRDPVNALQRIGKSFEDFLGDIKDRMAIIKREGKGEPVVNENKCDRFYRVQIGCFEQKENAEKLVRKAKKAGFAAIIHVDVSS